MTRTEEGNGSLPTFLDDRKSNAKPERIDFIGVGFRYSKFEEWVFRNVSFSILPGEHVAIVGSSGCGKSTLVKVLLGLLGNQEGQVMVGGIPISKFGISNWRGCVGVVMQEDQLFSGTVIENISCFDSSPNRELVEECALMAGVHEDISRLSMGYFTNIGDMGTTFSSGQKQRIVLARALYKQPSVLVLDEATSNLDINKEKEVNKKILKMNITRIVIAHRPETIAMADRVFDLESRRFVIA